jgi:hypothetical protein
MSAAEMRMKQLTEGKAGTAKPAASAFFSGRGDVLDSLTLQSGVGPVIESSLKQSTTCH